MMAMRSRAPTLLGIVHHLEEAASSSHPCRRQCKYIKLHVSQLSENEASHFSMSTIDRGSGTDSIAVNHPDNCHVKRFPRFFYSIISRNKSTMNQCSYYRQSLPSTKGQVDYRFCIPFRPRMSTIRMASIS